MLKPTVNDSFFVRICNALGVPPRVLAKDIGVKYAEIKPLLTGSAGELVDVDRDEVWLRLYEHVSAKMGMLIAIRHELDKKLQTDRKKRLLRTERFKEFYSNMQKEKDS